MSERKKLFNPKAPLVEQIEFYRHEYQTAKTSICRKNYRSVYRRIYN